MNQPTDSHQILLRSPSVGSAALKSTGCAEGRSLNKMGPSGKEERWNREDEWQNEGPHTLSGCPAAPVASLTTTRASPPPRQAWVTGHDWTSALRR